MADKRESFKETLTRLLKAQGFNNAEEFSDYCKEQKNTTQKGQNQDSFELDTKLYDDIELSVNETIIPEIEEVDFSFLDKEMKL